MTRCRLREAEEVEPLVRRHDEKTEPDQLGNVFPGDAFPPGAEELEQQERHRCTNEAQERRGQGPDGGQRGLGEQVSPARKNLIQDERHDDTFLLVDGDPSRAEVFANRTAECTTTLPMRYPGWSGGNDRIMDADFRTYLRAAQGEEPPIGAGEPRWAETEALARKLIAGGQAEPALKALKPEPQARKRWDLLLLAGLLNEALGERGASLEAFEIRPNDPHFLSELSQILERRGEPDEARGMRLRAIELWLELNHPEAVSDELFRVVEEDLPHEPARAGAILLRYAAAVSWEDSEPILDLALPELTRRGAGLWSWRELEPVGARAPQTTEARKLLTTLLRIAVASEPDPDAIVAG